MVIKLKEETPEEYEELTPEEYEKYEAELRRIRFRIAFVLIGPLLAWLFYSGIGDDVLVTVKTKYTLLVTTVERYKQRLLMSRSPVEVRSLSIRKAPGSSLLKFVDFFYSQKTVENTFMPLVADWRTEYFEALMKGRKWKAEWISIRYRYSFIQAMGLNAILSIIKFLIKR